MSSTDRRPALVQSYDAAADIVTGVRADQLEGPTPCPDYDVATLVDHLVFAGWRAAALGRGERLTDERPHVSLVDAPAELRRAASDAERGWADDARLTATVQMPWGETYAGATLVDMYLAELATHSWDLAAATGQLDRLNGSFVHQAHEGARAMLKPEYRDMMGKGNPYGAEVETPADATEWDRFVAFMGRNPTGWRRIPL